MERGKLETRNIILYAVVAYAFSWIFWLPQVLDSNHVMELPHSLVYMVGFVAPFGPLVAAFSLTYLTEGKEAVEKLLKRGADHRFGKIWLIPLFLLFPLWAGTSLLLGILTGATIDLPWFSNPLSLAFNFGIHNFFYMFIFVGLAEEFGWRGYTLDKLQARFNAITSSVLLGLVWTFWHLPLFYIIGSGQQMTGIGPYLAQILFFSLLFTWIHNNTNGSVLAAIVFHTMMDLTFLTIFPVTSLFQPSSLPVLSLYLFGLIILVVIVIIWGPKRLARKMKK